MKKIIVEVPDDYTDEACDDVEIQVTEWLLTDKPVLVLRGLTAHVFDGDTSKGASVETKREEECQV